MVSKPPFNSAWGYAWVGALAAAPLLVLAIASLAGAGLQRGAAPVVPARNARDVFNNYLFSERKLLVVTGEGDVLAESVARWRQDFPMDRGDLRGLSPPVIASFGGMGGLFELTFATADAVAPEALVGTAVVLVGTASSNRLIAELGEAAPVRFDGTPSHRGRPRAVFEFLGRHYEDVGDVLNVRVRSPYDDKMPLYLVTGNDDTEVSRQFFRFLQGDDFEVLRHGQRTRFGAFDDGEHRLGVERDHDLDAELRNGARSEHYRLRLHHDVAVDLDLQGLLREREIGRSRVTEFLGGPPIEETTEAVLFQTLEEKAYHTGTSRHTDFNPASITLSLAVEGDLHALDWPREAIDLVRRRLGRPEHVALETGLGVYLAPTWWRDGYRTWAARLAAADQLWPLPELLDNRGWEWRSEQISEALAGSLVAYLVEEAWGRERFLEDYRTWSPDEAEVASVEAGWHAWVAEIEAPAPARRHLASRFQRGVNVTNEAFQIEGGFLSKTADASLDRAAALGVDAVAIVPYARHPTADEPIPIGFFRSPRKETDGGVIHTALQAKTRGMSVLIKPQLEGPWPGFIKMSSTEDWDAFFREYERFVVHYAMLAELVQADVLSIGVELVEATNGQDERWRQIANRTREVFGGDLVYAANWGGEFERVAFWDALDYVGIDSYYPLSESDAPTDEELRAGAAAIIERVHGVQQTYGKPVLFTEIGYSGSQMPWKEPWADGGRVAGDPSAQARAFEAMTAAMQNGREAGWIAGTYWWKWSTSLASGGGPADASHRFHDKAAERVLAAWYTGDPE